MKIVLIIPTKDRPIDIQNLFASIVSQTRKPDLVIVIDGSDNPIKSIVDRFNDQVNLSYFPCRPPSLPKQRNLGIKNIPKDSDWVGFLDDDLVLEDDALENLEKLIVQQNNPNLKGIGLSIINQPVTRSSFFNKLFLMASKAPGEITKAGYPTIIPFVKQDTNTKWIYGGATFWSADVFEKFTFDEWFFGTGYMEDVDFSYRVSRNYDLMISSKAQCNHYHHGIPASKEASIGEWQLTSWWYFVKKYNDFSRFAIFWAMFGLIIKNWIKILLCRTSRDIQRSRGHLRGLIKIISGKALELKGFSK